MPYLIGTDEAGYGPNLGPLIISATVWSVGDDVWNGDLMESLRGVISSTRGRDGPNAAVVVADSKSLYTPSTGLKRLECNLLNVLEAAGYQPPTWREVWKQLAPGTLGRMRGIPWYRDFNAPLPFWG